MPVHESYQWRSNLSQENQEVTGTLEHPRCMPGYHGLSQQDQKRWPRERQREREREREREEDLNSQIHTIPDFETPTIADYPRHCNWTLFSLRLYVHEGSWPTPHYPILFPLERADSRTSIIRVCPFRHVQSITILFRVYLSIDTISWCAMKFTIGNIIYVHEKKSRQAHTNNKLQKVDRISKF